MDNLQDIVSKNIIYLRTGRKMTQLELGESLSYSDKAVSKWERGEAIPDAYVLKKMAEIFNVTVDYLLSPHDEKELKAAGYGRLNSRDIITFISFLGTWTLGITIFAILWLCGHFLWIVLIYSLPVSFIVMVVLTALWGSRTTNVFNVSFLIWSLLTAIYLTFLSHNFWFVFIIGIPAQMIVLLGFGIRIKK